MVAKLFRNREDNRHYTLQLSNLVSSISFRQQYCKLRKRKLAVCHSALPVHCYFYSFLLVQLIHSPSKITIFSRSFPFTALSRCTSSPFSKHSTSFFHAVLEMATFTDVMPHTAKECRAVCTARVPIAVQRRRTFVQSLAKMKRNVSLLERTSSTCKQATSAQL